MATYIALLQWTDQGIRSVKDTTRRAAAAKDAAAKMGVKFTDLFWTLGQYDLAIVAEAPAGARLMSEEAFGPVVVVQPVANVDAALGLANSSEFGLQGACFTASLETAFKVSRKLRVGSLWINEASRFRLDTYPFGGVGSSGFGREGVRYAMEEMSQWKFTGIRLNPKPG